jgi:hypothetical protein
MSSPTAIHITCPGLMRPAAPAPHPRGLDEAGREPPQFVGQPALDEEKVELRVSIVAFEDDEAHLRRFTWRRLLLGLRSKHRPVRWKYLRRRYLPGWWPTDGTVSLFEPRRLQWRLVCAVVSSVRPAMER